MTTKNISQLTFFLWLRRDVDELKLMSDDKNYDKMYAASSLTDETGLKCYLRTTGHSKYIQINCLCFKMYIPVIG